MLPYCKPIYLSLQSLPLHIQLFELLGFKPCNYAHIAPITIKDQETGNIRKISKRKDPWFGVKYYDENGNVVEVHCTYDPETKAGSGFTGRKVKGTIHWVPAPYAVKAEVRLYENIVDEEKGVYNEDGSINVNPNSLTVLKECYLEPSFDDVKAYDSFQFVRQGYFCVDAKDSTPEHLVFNRIVSLKSSFKIK